MQNAADLILYIPEESLLDDDNQSLCCSTHLGVQQMGVMPA
jgi:hypothetical protein